MKWDIIQTAEPFVSRFHIYHTKTHSYSLPSPSPRQREQLSSTPHWSPQTTIQKQDRGRLTFVEVEGHHCMLTREAAHGPVQVVSGIGPVFFPPVSLGKSSLPCSQYDVLTLIPILQAHRPGFPRSPLVGPPPFPPTPFWPLLSRSPMDNTSCMKRGMNMWPWKPCFQGDVEELQGDVE